MKGKIKMNLLQAFKFLDMVTESYQEDYKNYIVEHKERVKQVADWLKENLPELFDNIDLEAFNEIIQEHDESKYSEEEFEAYAQRFYNNGEEGFEFKEAWKHHWTHNEHHPEFWLGEDMPYIYILEMICDWGSFSIEKKDFTFKELSDFYYTKAKDDEEKNLSDNTKIIIEEILDKINSVVDD
jgi:molecular chaperone DnaK (HSP70)